MEPTITDIVVCAALMCWNCLSLTARPMKNGIFDTVFPTQQALEKLMLDTHFTFAPGLLDAVHSKTPPTISYFKNLPLHLVKLWAVYLLVLEKPGHRPKVYIGSGTQRKEGVYSRIRQYNRGKQFGRHVQRAIDNGYTVSHKGLLCWSPLPTAAKRYRLRVLFLLIETAFTLHFWTMVSRTGDYGMPHLCPWSLDAMEYDGSCGHFSLTEGSRDIYEDLTNEQIEALEAERQLKHSRRDALNRGKEDKARGEVLRINNNRASKKYKCDLCDVVFGTGAGLRRHNRTQKHMDNVAGITKVVGRPGQREEQHRNIEARIYYCKLCNYAAGTSANLNTHFKSGRHLTKVAAESST